MAWITSDDLTWMRQDASQTLPDTCNLLTETRTSDSAGGWTSTWGTVTGGSALACRFDPAITGRGVNVIAGAEGMTYDYKVTFAYDAPLALNMRVEHGGLTYELQEFVNDNSWSIVRKALVVRIA